MAGFVEQDMPLCQKFLFFHFIKLRHQGFIGESAPANHGDWQLMLAFRTAESAREIDDEAYQQDQANSAAADDGTAKVKPAAAEQKKKNN